MKWLVKDSSFYKTFFWLTAMMGLQNLLTYSVNLADNMMLGQYSETAVAASSIVNQIQYLLQMTSVNGLGAGGLILVSQYWGQNNRTAVKRIIALTMKFAFAAGVVFCIVCVSFPSQVVGLLTTDVAVGAEAARYLRIIGITYLIFPMQAALILCLRGVHITKLGPAVSSVSLLLNVVFNYLLIFGNFGCPELGIEGAAWSSLIARIVEFSVVLAFVLAIDKKLQMKLADFITLDWYYLKDFLKIALPVVGEGVTFGIANVLQIAIIGRLMQPVIAANAIAVTMHQIATVFSFGAASSSSVVIGQALGENRLDLMKPYAKTLQLIYIGLGLATSAALYFAIGPVLSLYRISPETQVLAQSMVGIMCVTVIGSSYQYPVMCGIIAGGGNTLFAFLMDIIFTLGIAVTSAALSAFVFAWPPLVTFFLIRCDQILKCIPNAIVVNRYQWAKNLTRD